MTPDLLWAPFGEFAFMRRALFGGVALACSAGPLGVFLILRRMSLIGDAIAQYLGAPEQLVFKVPTADLEELRPGKPDEEAHGVSYAEIDAFLHGQPVSEHAYTTIVRTYDNSQHKRQLPLMP